MSLREQLDSDMKASLRAGDSLRLSVIRLVRSAVHNEEIAKGSPLTDDEILQVVAKESKRRREAVEMFAKAGRDDLVDKETAELHILAGYLPQQLSEEDVLGIAQEVVTGLLATSKADKGRIMGAMMQRVRGRADGKLVSAVVDRLLDGTSG